MMPIMARWICDGGLDALERELQRRPATWLWAILAVAFVARIVVAAVFTDFDPTTANIWEYGEIARATLAHGHGQMVSPMGILYSGPPSFVYPTALMPPFVIWVWIGLFALFGVTKLALSMMTVLNVLTSVGIVYYSIRIARALFGSEVIALLAGIVMALHPVFVYSVATYHALNIYILMLLIVFDLTLSTRRQTYALSVFVGVLAGIAALVRTEYLVLVGAILLGSFITHRQWKLTAVAAVIAFVVVAPWTARNYVVFHRFIPVASETWPVLFKAYNPDANGAGNWEGTNWISERLLSNQINDVPLDRNYENAINDIFHDAVIDYMTSHPIRSFVVLPMYKFVFFWMYTFPETKTHQLLYQLQFWPLFVLSIIGLSMAAHSGYFARPDHRTVLILFTVQTFVMMISIVNARYRMNVEPFLYAYAAVGAVGLSGWLRRGLRISRPLGSARS
jgi:hypothetical protein